MNFDFNIYQYSDYVLFLSDLYKNAVLNKSSYSQVEFANDIGLKPPRVSQILKRKEGLSAKKATILSEKLDLSEKETDYLYHLISSQTAKSLTQREVSQKFIEEHTKSHSPLYLSMKDCALLEYEGWDIIWSFFEFNEDFRDLKKVSKITGLGIDEIDLILKKMESIDLIEINDGMVSRLKKNINFGNGIPNKSVRNHHKYKIINSLKALDFQDTTTRKNESITFSLNKSQYAVLSKKIETFLDTLFEGLEDDDNPDDIATLNIALFSALNLEKNSAH